MNPDQIHLSVNGRRRSLSWLFENVEAATVVRVVNCPGLTALPALEAATDVWVENCPGLTALPALEAATVVWVENCPGLTALPALEAATVVRVENCPGLTALPALEAATDVRVVNCPGLTALPALEAATVVRVVNCPGLTLFIEAGVDGRGYMFRGLVLRGQWFVQAGCRLLSLEDARKHWGPGAPRHRDDCHKLVERIADYASGRQNETVP
ncbi:MAG: hypothetical protein KBC46_03285 [Ferrovibrio sp.]|nr:hypothetical protein [Ferrovibrio sp.]